MRSTRYRDAGIVGNGGVCDGEPRWHRNSADDTESSALRAPTRATEGDFNVLTSSVRRLPLTVRPPLNQTHSVYLGLVEHPVGGR